MVRSFQILFYVPKSTSFFSFVGDLKNVNVPDDYYLPTDLKNNDDVNIFRTGAICERISRQLGYCGFKDYLHRNMNDTWKHLKSNQGFEPRFYTIGIRRYGAWTSEYDTAAIANEKWKEAIDFYHEGKLTGITSLKICTMIDENGISHHFVHCEWKFERLSDLQSEKRNKIFLP